VFAAGMATLHDLGFAVESGGSPPLAHRSGPSCRSSRPGWPGTYATTPRYAAISTSTCAATSQYDHTLWPSAAPGSTATTGQTSPDGPVASVNVRPGPASVGEMSQVDWAEAVARSLLKKPLPHRWAHSQGVAAQARTLAPILGRHADAVTAAAWLHDIGYGPGPHGSGFHPLDGARYLRDVQHADALVCRLVAHHSCAAIEAAERGLAADLFREFRPVSRVLSDALIYCDMTTGPQ